MTDGNHAIEAVETRISAQIDGLSQRVGSLEQYRARSEVRHTHFDERFDQINDRLDELKDDAKEASKRIESLLGWLVKTIFGAIIVGVVVFMLSGGFATP